MLNRLLVFLCSIFLLSSCIIDDKENDIESINYSVDRTIFLYMAADNSLSSYSKPNIDSLIDGVESSQYNCNIIIYEDNADSEPVLWQIEKDSKNRITKSSIKRYVEQNSASKDIIRDVISEVFNMFPAKENILILWSHGTGWLPGKNYKLSSDPSYITTENHFSSEYTNKVLRSFGDNQGDNCDIWELREALEESNVKFETIIFDACLMACAEVFYELKDLTHYIIASPSEILAEGFPYSSVMPYLLSPEIDNKAVCESFYLYYLNQTREQRQSATITLADCSKMDILAASCKDFLNRNSSKLHEIDLNQIQQYGRSSQGMNNVFFDLNNYLSFAEETKSNYYNSLINEIVVYTRATDYFLTIEIDPLKFSGISVFVPDAKMDLTLHDAYKNLRWYKEIYLN